MRSRTGRMLRTIGGGLLMAAMVYLVLAAPGAVVRPGQHGASRCAGGAAMSGGGEGTTPDSGMESDPLSQPPESPACLFCGEPELFEIAEVWGHEFMVETCCEGLIWTVKLGFRLTSHLPSSPLVSNGWSAESCVPERQVQRVARAKLH